MCLKDIPCVCDTEFRYLALGFTRRFSKQPNKQTNLHSIFFIHGWEANPMHSSKNNVLWDFLKILHYDCRFMNFALFLDFPVCCFKAFQVFLGLIFSHLPSALFKMFNFVHSVRYLPLWALTWCFNSGM